MASNQTFTLNIKALFDASDVKNKVGDIQNALKNIKLPDTLKRSLDTSFVGVNKALDDFNSKVSKGVKTKTDATGITRSFDNVTKELDNLDKLLLKVKGELGDGVDLSQIIRIDGETKTKVEQLKNEIGELQKKISAITTDKLDSLKEKLDKITSPAASKHASEAFKLFEEGDVQSAIDLLDQVIAKQEQIKKATEAKGNNTSNIQNNIEQLTALRNIMTDALPEVQQYNDEIGQKGAQAAELLNNAQQQAAQSAKDMADGFHEVVLGAKGASGEIDRLTTEQANFNKEIDQIKSRIQYFFGLSNAINLVKRAIRGAFDTIKSLDKAMTETAVVTDFSVSDMWAQLPEYTKRANELGVTTQAAYEAATLYYQQGLKTNEVNALSVETLKMARIAGLDAAEATDRMTNALRGFNMALTEANAQRVDDVYSELAANTASNVDEISTAMTKVASLAHNANMEFETTAAFLSQIIETTRESAETAGTALKTVVARFSEVKKLVDEGTLRGQDEEGQIIDVNRVGAALRTAGIDLNKYFLGEVGLDDIFMELASKWDSLTSMQQRYIATQAAGSRQQSRFIALMSDYARTQELVGKAYNANGAAARQFEKTQESLESKLARLKNAWDEFLMGLTNNQMVKGFVDLLTDLLNFVNKLTSGFDSTTNSVLKFTAALAGFAGLKFLTASKGPLDTLLGTLLEGTMLGNGLFKGGILSGKVMGGVIPGSQAAADAAAATATTRTPLIFGSGSLLSKAGKGIWNGAQLLGTKAGGLFGADLAGTAAGLTGIASALGAIAIAAGVVYTAYQLWLNLTPQGQLKQLEKYAKAMDNVASSTSKAADTARNAQQAYSNYNDAVKNAKTVEERQKAIDDRTEYVNQLLQENKDLAKYVESSSENGRFVLTINEDQLAHAVEELSTAATKAAAEASLTNAAVAGQQAAIYSNRSEAIIRQMSPEKYAQYRVEENNALSEMQTYAQQGYLQLLSGQDFGDDLANALASAFAQNFDAQEYLKQLKLTEQMLQVNINYDSTEELAAEYKKLYGANPTEELLGNKSELRKAVASAMVNEGSIENASKIIELLQGKQGSDYQALLDAWNGTGKMAEINLEGVDSAEDLMELLGFGDLTNEQLQEFANLLEINTGSLEGDVQALKDHIKAQANSTKQLQAQARANVFEQMMRAGMNIPAANKERINQMTPAEVARINEVATSAEGLLSQEDYQGLFNELISGAIDEEFATQLTDLFSSINLDDPIDAFNKLAAVKKEALSSGNIDLALYVSRIQKANAETFTASNLVQSFITSADYESLTDSLADFIKENGHISARNIEELAGSNNKLKQLLDSNVVSAKALANALTLVESGKITFDQLNDAMLKALDSGKSFAEVLADVSGWIEDFDKGTDLKLGTEHAIEQLKELGEYVDNWEFGNEPTQAIWEHIFGPGTYQPLLDQFGNDFAGLEAYIEGEIEKISGMAENAGLGGIQAATAAGITGLREIAGSGGQFFEWDLSQFSSTTEAINEVANALHVSQEMAESFILSWQSHMPALRTEWDQLNFETQLQTYIENLGDARIATEQDLIALGAAVDETGHVSAEKLQEIIDKINETRNKAGKDSIEIPVIVNWQDESGAALSGEDLLNQYKQQFGSENGESITLSIPIRVDDRDEEVIYRDIDSVFADLIQYINSETGNLDIDGILANLTSKGLSGAQAAEIAEEFSNELGGALLQRTIQIPVETDGTVKMVEKTVTGADLSGLEANINAELQAADVQLLANKMAGVDSSGFSENISSSASAGMMTGLQAGLVAWQSGLTSIEIPITLVPTGGIFPIGFGATGGIVKSFAGGSANTSLSPGFALTGEEGPEIVWNKNEGYAYVTGGNGPEFQNLQPGDRVFNAAETSRIFRNSSFARGGIFDSYASGGWKPTNKKNTGGGGSGSGSKDSEKESNWRNELDWLYNLMEDIVELERDQKAIEEEYEDLLKDQTKTGGDLYRLLVKQLGNLYTQLDHQNFALRKREQEMREFMDKTNDQDQYLWYNWEDRTLEIDWDAIDKIRDEEQYKHVKELVDEAEAIQDKIDDADDSIMDITNQIQELENIWRDTFTDFESRVLDAIIKSYQQIIDNYSELNDTLNNSNSQILDSLQKQISLERQIRDNTKTEEEISNEEARLAYLRRDTSGSNDLAALQLERELADQRQDYEDSLVDQAISRLQEDNDAAAQQRERQIEIMQAQLDYQSENGEFNAYVSDLLTSAMGADGELLTNSDLVTLLKEQENWDAMSAVSKEVWDEELNGTFKEVAAFLLKQNAEENGTFYTALTAAVNSVSSVIGSYSQAMTKLGNSISDVGRSGGGNSGGSSSSNNNSGGNSKKPSDSLLDDRGKTGSSLSLEEMIRRYGGAGGCFAPGTKILMADNSIKNIEFIKVGDIVVAYNELTKDFVPKKVIKSYAHHNTPTMIKLIFTDNSELELTPGHPLYSTKGWKSLDIENSLYEHDTVATLLHIGDEIIGINGNKIVKSIEKLNIGTNYDSYNIAVEDCHTFLANGLVAHNSVRKSMRAYATGGLANSTGLAWLDGTPSEPEYVLNARQTDAFLRLADILPSMVNDSLSTTQNTFGSTYVNLSVNLESVSPDYDVDRMVSLVKDKLYDAGSYRNINSLSFLR